MAKTRNISATSIPSWLLTTSLLFLIMRLCLSFTESIYPPKASEEIKWKDYKEYKDSLALNSLSSKQHHNRLVLFYFTAKWCEQCKKLDRTAFQSKDILRIINTQFIPIKVIDQKQENGKNSEITQELEDRFSIQAFPSLVVTMSDGTKVTEYLGSGNINLIKKYLTESLSIEDYFQGKESFVKLDFAPAAKSFDHFLELNSWQHWRSAHAALLSYLSHYQLSEKQKALAVLQEAKKEIQDHNFPYPLFDYLSGKTSFDQILKVAAENKSLRLMSYAYAGMLAYAEEKYDDARDKFNWVLSNCSDENCFEYRIAKSELTNLDKLEKAGYIKTKNKMK